MNSAFGGLMPTRFLAFYLLALFVFSPFRLFADETVPPTPVKLVVQSFIADNKNYIAVSFLNHPEWHTYWKNPGDAGLAIKDQFSIKKKDGKTDVKLEEEEWPSPKRFIENGTQWAYGYINSYTLFYRLEKADLNKLSGKEITLNSSWLVCRHICVPGQKEVQFKISDGKVTYTPAADALAPLTDLELSTRFMNLPKASPLPDYLEFKLSKGTKDKSLVLTYEVKKNTDVGFLKDANLLYSFPSAPFDFGHENLTVKESSLVGIVEINWDGEYSTPPETLPASGKFEKPHTIKFLFNDPVQRKVIVVEKKFTGFDLAQAASPVAAPPAVDTLHPEMPKAVSETQSGSLIYYLALAFFGGLILNIMPCVLPVISIKLFGLVKYRNESRKVIIRHNFFYTLGILSTFVILACIVLALKSIGTQVGWGFQLQSPNFIALMIVALFIFSLNLFGMFEFITPGGKHLGNLQTKEGFLGDFLSGVLATILSTPCSAPFLGTALTFAFTSSSYTIFSIFIMIGLGLAFPFIMTGFFPKLVSFLPRPGNWMNNVKKFLGLTLILTTIWLFDVYNALVDGSAQLMKLATVCALVFFAIALKRKDKWISGITSLIALLIFVNLSTSTVVSSKDEQTALIRDKKAKGLNWEPWSLDRMKEYKENRQVVFIDFTAKWCFTCKVNERLVLDTDNFKTFVSENNVKLLIGDWTKRDEVIGSFLKQNGLVGVPAYFVQKKDGTLVGLGETVSIERIKAQIN
jgi:thiol:disulfide interchange protein/DsbC/DsbD-like thiol-disulfide interchange protein